MGFIYFIGCFAIFLGIERGLNYLDKNGYFLNSNLKSYYHSIKDILSPYSAIDYVDRILSFAKIHLKEISQNYKTEILKQNHHPKDMYYIDVYNNADDYYFRQAWAYMIIDSYFQTHKVDTYLDSSTLKLLNTLKQENDKQIKKILSNKDNYPKSLILAIEEYI